MDNDCAITLDGGGPAGNNNKKLIDVKVAFNMKIDANAYDNIVSTMTHHIDSIVDMESWPEISNINDVRIERMD